MATIYKNAREWIAVFFAASLLAACGGGGSSTADTTPPTVSAFSVKNGAAISASSDASYAVSGNLGTTQEYTVTFSEKLDATSYTVKMLDTNNSPVALPTGMTATLAANDATNLAYTLTITTSGSFAFDAGQTSKAVQMTLVVKDTAGNSSQTSVNVTVNDTVPSANAVLQDWFFTDNAGNAPMAGLNADGSYLTFPLAPSQITNPLYVVTETCYGSATNTPNCYDPIHSYWGIDASVIDSAGRAIVYTFDVSSEDSSGDVASMRENLTISSAGLLTQTCWTKGYSETSKPPNIPYCYDANSGSGGTDNFTISITATPVNGSKPLRRSVKFKVRDDG